MKKLAPQEPRKKEQTNHRQGQERKEVNTATNRLFSGSRVEMEIQTVCRTVVVVDSHERGGPTRTKEREEAKY